MSNYIAGGLMLIVLVGVTLLGMEAFGIYDAARMVDAALLDGQVALSVDGGVSDRVQTLVKERIVAEGGIADRLTIAGSQPRTPAGRIVALEVAYDYHYLLHGPLLDKVSRGTFHIVRTARTLSGWQP